MQTIIALFGLSSVVVMLVGFISIVVPLERIGIKSRTQGIKVLGIALVALVICIKLPDDSKDGERLPVETPTKVADTQLAQNPPAPPACSKDWKVCTDNKDFVENSGRWNKVRAACEIATEKVVKYGEPKWPSWTSGGSFGSYLIGGDYVGKAVAVAVEPDVQVSNGFGAMVHARASCVYDLNSELVLDVSLAER